MQTIAKTQNIAGKDFLNKALSFDFDLGMTFALVLMEGEESRMDIFKTIEAGGHMAQRVTVAIVGAADRSVLSVVKMATDKNYCSFLLFDDENDIARLAGKVNLDLNRSDITMIHSTLKPEEDAIAAIRQDRAQLLMKGKIPTKTLLKAVLNKETGLRASHVLSHVALFEIPDFDRPLLLTDAAMNIKPTLEQKVSIINNAVKVAQGVGIKQPKVAVLAAVEVVNETMPSTLDAAVLTQMSHRHQITNCLIDGPLALDVAISEKAVQQKNIQSQVAGVADILLVPDLEVGNALYKSFVYLAQARVASVISGAQVPIVLTSRADSPENKLSSLQLAMAAL